MEALEFADDPAGFVLFGFQLDDADFFAFFFIGARTFLGKSALTVFWAITCVATRRMLGVER